jgi:hypothetical protein
VLKSNEKTLGLKCVFAFGKMKRVKREKGKNE